MWKHYTSDQLAALPAVSHAPVSPGDAPSLIVWALISEAPTLRLAASRGIAATAVRRGQLASVVVDAQLQRVALAFAAVGGVSWEVDAPARDRCHTLAFLACRALVGQPRAIERLDERALLAIAAAASLALDHIGARVTLAEG